MWKSRILAGLVVAIVAPGAGAEGNTRALGSGDISNAVPEPPRFGFKAVDDGSALRESKRQIPVNDRALTAGNFPPSRLTPNDVPHSERGGSGVERLPDLQTYGRNPQIRRFGTLSGSSGIPRGVRSARVRP